MNREQLRRTAFFFDFDGTLSAIGPDPEKVGPVPDAPEALRELAAHCGYCAVVSARPVAFLARQVGASSEAGASGEGPELHGLYGLEFSPDGGATVHTLPEAAPYREVMGVAVEEAKRALPGALIEDKGLSCAVHYRNSPDLAEAAEEWVEQYAREHGLKVQRGRMVVELKPPVQRDKGAVVRDALTRLPELAGAWFFGDDLGDRPGFEALSERAERAPQFTAVRVAVANTEGDPLGDLADLMLEGPQEVPGLVRRLLRAS
ncbi:trehalose-phosphatase [Actinospica robiniae]|uniref:trehalose-phosphatase n=1 Tax=Actinospica robiniae TaxID=304901 RepID=UPI000426CA3A|nr:trehalose-phosphatase [Actinospica robiniae]